MYALNNYSIAQLVAMYNAHAPKPVKHFRDKATAVARVAALAAAAGLVPCPTGAAALVVPPAPTPVSPPATPRASRATYAEALVIQVVGAPTAKPGSKRAARAAVLANGITVGQYLNAAYAAHGGGRKRHKFNADLRRYVAAGLIQLVGV